MNATTAVSALRSYQLGLRLIVGLGLVNYVWPPHTTLRDGNKFDFIIVGGGSAGCVLASRLSEIDFLTVLLIEAGPIAPLETFYPKLSRTLKQSYVDWNYTSNEDGVNFQNRKEHVLPLSRGRMLGGCSASNNMLHMRGNPRDYDQWALSAEDDSWSWHQFRKFFLKSERLADPVIYNSEFKDLHGIDGYLGISRQPSEETVKYLEAFRELGYDTPLDTDSGTQVYYEPLYTIADQTRQSSAYAYLSPIRDRPNLKVAYNTQVTKVTFDSNNKATGVVVRTENGEDITLGAVFEVLLSAGAINTPQLLMLSGVGPAEHLQSLDIPVVADVPEVGKNLQDHPVVFMPYRMDRLNSTPPPSDPHSSPPAVVGYVALDDSQLYPDYQTISTVVKEAESLLTECSFTYQFDDSICESLYKAARGHEVFLTAHTMLHPQSKGEVLLRSADPLDPPVINTNYYSPDSNDLQNHAKYLEHYSHVLNTTYFKSVEARLLPLDPACAERDWECVARRGLVTIYHFASTCALGTVVDARLRVRNVTGLRVADASVMPAVTSGNNNAPVIALAEKAVDIIRNDYGI